LNDGVSASLAAGEELRCTFELQMHLGSGSYHVNVFAYEYSTSRPFSTWRSAASFFIGETRMVRGRANLHPRLDHYEIRPAATPPAHDGELPERFATLAGGA
jgi:hypothetical protein